MDEFLRKENIANVFKLLDNEMMLYIINYRSGLCEVIAGDGQGLVVYTKTGVVIE